MNFQHLVEKVRNPLRKKALQGQPSNAQKAQDLTNSWKESIKSGDVKYAEDITIRNKYLQLQKKFPERAEAWLDQQAKLEGSTLLRTKIDGAKKIYSNMGVDVYIDKYTDENFVDDPMNMRMIKHSVDKMLQDTRELMPNKKPKIVITNGKLHPKFKQAKISNPAGLYHDRLIYIDQYQIDEPDFFIHEFAHYVVDLIPTQTEPLLKKAYDEMLDIYWKSAKVKKRKLEADDRNDKKQVLEAERWRRTISAKLGFPEYGLSNFDEFFAVLIENWKKLPVNSATYRFKSLVKSILIRL